MTLEVSSLPQFPVPPSQLQEAFPLSLELEVAITLCVRVEFQCPNSDDRTHSDRVFEFLHLLVARPKANEQELSEALRELAELFASPHTFVSSYYRVVTV